MKILYLDLVGGISGDMFLGALIDLGVPLDTLKSELEKLPVDKWKIQTEKVPVHGITCTRVTVHTQHNNHTQERRIADIQKIIEASQLDPKIKEHALRVFMILAEAEAAVHSIPKEDVHFHEIGAVDSIIDIIGACIGLHLLNWPRVLASKPIDGSGTVNTAHGTLPVPVPAVLEICKRHNIPIQQSSESTELITPTGAALLAGLCSEFGTMPLLQIEATGYGAGSRQTRLRPNYLRMILGTPVQTLIDNSCEFDTIAILETNLDDVNPEILGYLVQKALDAGAIDIFYTPVIMKKNRPGIKLTALCPEELAHNLALLILRETGTFGLRKYSTQRWKLKREIITVQTYLGEIKIKLGLWGNEILHATPEFESCAKIAKALNIPIKKVYETAIEAAAQFVRKTISNHQ